MKISPRDIEVFVAGAFALTGFHALIWLPYRLVMSPDWGRIIADLITGIGLLIGIGILMSRGWAILLAQIYLWLAVVSGCIVFPIYFVVAPDKAGQIFRNVFPGWLESIVLLALIYWSRFRRVQPPDEGRETTSSTP